MLREAMGNIVKETLETLRRMSLTRPNQLQAQPVRNEPKITMLIEGQRVEINVRDWMRGH